MSEHHHYPYKPPDRCIFCQEAEIAALKARVAELEKVIDIAREAKA